jgi:deferrochelatase/peroxidase EfeB
MPPLPLGDIQGLILRSYGMNALAVFVLRVDRAAACRRALVKLPATSAAPWQTKPSFCVNVAITYDGLAALELPADSLQSFPTDFVEGAAARAALVGDVGTSAPDHWKPSLAQPGVHLLILLFAQDATVRAEQSAVVRSTWGEGGAATILTVLEGDMLPGEVAHFGYRDGFSQPTIAGGLANPVADLLPEAPAGEFLLGYQSQFNDLTYAVPRPSALGANGSFLALRLLEQDCAAFEAVLDQAPAYGISRETLAAKFVGRWRNGVPLTLSPDSDSPTPPIPIEQFNSYDYAPSDLNPEGFDDRRGYRCPIGSHMRRGNPRHAIVAGNSGLRHRIVRRGLPYGPPFDPANPHDGIERGLLGLFIAVSLKDQFEFLMHDWISGDIFAPGLSGTMDPLLGNYGGGTGTFTIPRPNARPIVVSGVPQLVTTRGAAYAFLPSLTALDYIASL